MLDPFLFKKPKQYNHAKKGKQITKDEWKTGHV